MAQHQLGPLTQIPEGEGRTFEVGAQRVAVFRTRKGEVYATQAECPHRKGPLADGLLGVDTLVCPLHDWSFDLHTGEAKQGSCGVAVYPITQNAEGMMVLTL
ncbi:MAG: Nitrite reductase small subunit, probable [Myxococcaceae bacterium]|nr:Nitrite reductase small subunit, probable [Myxococcaceae bacterium]